MLQLQRASAGSGKTYTLAKKFIWYLIATKRDNGQWRLRKPQEIADGLPRILAITFTNKATNEMKQRIVEKLAAIARADGKEQLSEKQLDKTDYLRDFARDLKAPAKDVGAAARQSLKVLLNDYSDFKVSTIDSFFQTVLRTFAYESNLNDSYQVEIDSDFIATEAIDSTLDDINNNENADTRFSFWLSRLIEEEADAGHTTWNVFLKNDRKGSIYNKLKKSINRLESEDFKNVRERLDQYFITSDGGNGRDPLISSYTETMAKVEGPLKDAVALARKTGSELEALFKKNGLDIKETGHKNLAPHIQKLQKLQYNTSASDKNIFSPYDLSKKSLFKKGMAPENPEPFETLAAEMYGAYSRWLELRKKPEWLHWSIYKPLLPYLGLISLIRGKMRNFLDENNSIQLGETSSMLRKIIGKDDTPFIYERMGSAINHYLIDEFQDTSRLQWENLEPLLSESLGRGGGQPHHR